MIQTPRLDADDVRRALKALKEIDPQIVKDLRKELRSKLSPVAQQVAAAVPIDPPLSGFRNAGETRWSAVTPKTSFTPGRSKKTGNSLVAVRIQPKEGRGVYIAELAGSRTSGSTASGQSLIRVLNERQPMKGKGGRYIYAKFRLLRPDVINIAERILNDTFRKLENKL
jgi:hypothetical protein